jgi:hypothetical protein
MQGIYWRSPAPPAGSRPGHALGAHNDDTYGEVLGLSAAERAALRRERVI